MKGKYCKEDFLRMTKELHGDKYNYSNTIYTRDCDNVIVTCPIHGDFEIKANKLMNGHGCEKCSESNLERGVRIMLKNKNILYIN